MLTALPSKADSNKPPRGSYGRDEDPHRTQNHQLLLNRNSCSIKQILHMHTCKNPPTHIPQIPETTAGANRQLQDTGFDFCYLSILTLTREENKTLGQEPAGSVQVNEALHEAQRPATLLRKVRNQSAQDAKWPQLSQNQIQSNSKVQGRITESWRLKRLRSCGPTINPSSPCLCSYTFFPLICAMKY